MFLKIFIYLLALIFIITSINTFAETKNKLETGSQGIGALGRIEPRSRVIKVSHNAGPTGARVAQLFFQEADRVDIGEKIAILSDHTKKVAEVKAAKTQIKVLEAQRAVEQVAFTFNEKEFLRYQSLEQESLASISLLDSKQLAVEQSKAHLKRLTTEILNAQSEKQILEADLDNTIIYAPISGTVLKILTWPGERIRENGLLELADLTKLDVVAEIYESDLPSVKSGQKAHINASGLKRPYIAEVRELGFQVKKNNLNDTDPLSDMDNRIIEVRLTLEPEAVKALQHQIFRQVHVRINYE